jgi:protein involved in polysaccharide export with SLBB domain
MHKLVRVLFLLLFSVFLSTSSIFAQSTSGSEQTFSTSSIGRYYVDQAGLELLQSSPSLDAFIDPQTYYLGPYDVISIYGKGLVEFNYRAITVNAVGDVSTPLTGVIPLSGKTLAEASSIISDAFEKEIRDTEISVTLDRPQTCECIYRRTGIYSGKIYTPRRHSIS